MVSGICSKLSFHSWRFSWEDSPQRDAEVHRGKSKNQASNSIAKKFEVEVDEQPCSFFRKLGVDENLKFVNGCNQMK